MLVQGATGGMATALIQLGAAAGFEVWVTSRSKEGREMAERLASSHFCRWREASTASGRRYGQCWSGYMGTLARVGPTRGHRTYGGHSGNDPSANLLKLFVEQITVAGTIMGTLDEMKSLMNFVVQAGIKPEIGEVMPMSDAERAFRAMAGGETHWQNGVYPLKGTEQIAR